MNEINKIGGNINQIVKNNSSHLYKESDKIDLIKYMEEINGLINELVMTV
ncbi:MAG: MobC family plasmid mobilization relaxosome protein [Lachnospiraceae bacterium]|nr:MobC family plasmid mobilization relaxosome protein [Lachnospiraceae bacterium]